ncbi:MAG: phospholipase, partial [Planctomycetaceae bacterium]|nr:phospholipase [Planctomycetaceae bacterium]
CIGMSQGASFVHLLATKRANKIAAVVMHSGFLSRFEAGENSCPMMLIAGEDDPAFPLLRANVEQYRSHGHPITFVRVTNLGHEWSRRNNEDIWRFLSLHYTTGGED